MSSIALLSMSILTGCGSSQEVPAEGVTISGAENAILGFTYLLDLGDGYKLYADNFTKIVYLKYEFSDGRGATAVGGVSMTPYLSPNGNYYTVNPTTRVIEELTKDTNQQSSNEKEKPEATPDQNATQNPSSTQTPLSQQEEIEAILNQNSEKNGATSSPSPSPTTSPSTQPSATPEASNGSSPSPTPTGDGLQDGAPANGQG